MVRNYEYPQGILCLKFAHILQIRKTRKHILRRNYILRISHFTSPFYNRHREKEDKEDIWTIRQYAYHLLPGQATGGYPKRDPYL